MFMNHLTGPSASRTSMIVNVNPAADDFDETQHVLSYAVTARNVKISATDYNKKRRILAKESNVKLSPVKKVANLVKKLKRKGSGDTKDSKPDAKRLRSNTGAINNSTKRPTSTVVVAKKTLPARAAKAQPYAYGNDEVERLKEENFRLQITIDDLEQQLADCEADVRAEVVEMMNEQLQESKEWYEGRIDNLKQQLSMLQASNSKRADNDKDTQERINDFYDRLAECEEEMKRMREEHEAELEDKSAEVLNMANVHAAEMEQAVLVHQDELRTERERKDELEQENGALRHQNEELRASHDAILAKYNELLSVYQNEQDNLETYGTIDTMDTDEPNDDIIDGPTYKKLPRERGSAVASTDVTVDILSPKKKNGKMFGFLKSPKGAKVAVKDKSPPKSRSPLGKLNSNMD